MRASCGAAPNFWRRSPAYKVRPAANGPAARFETGTPSFEAQAGTLATIDYLEWLGETLVPHLVDRPARLRAAMNGCAAYERELGERLLTGLARMNSVRLYGPPTMNGRVPTFAFTVEDFAPEQVGRHLAARNIFVWTGHFYAIETAARLGLRDAGGLVRVGLCHYTTAAEVDLLLDALAEIVA